MTWILPQCDACYARANPLGALPTRIRATWWPRRRSSADLLQGLQPYSTLPDGQPPPTVKEKWWDLWARSK